MRGGIQRNHLHRSVSIITDYFIFDSGYINTVFVLPCFSLQPVSVMVRPVKMAARAVYQREELLTAYACPDTVVKHALVSVMSQ